MRINYQALVKDCRQLMHEKRKDEANCFVQEAIADSVFAPDDFSIADLAEACFGREFHHACNPDSGQNVAAIMEADGVDSTAFSNITGQIVYSKILQAFEMAGLVGTGLIPTVPTRLSGEKLPGIAQMADEDEEVGEGMPFSEKGFGEEYLNTPETVKRGFIVPVTKEAIFFDRTNLILQRAGQVGESLALGKEKRILKAILGEASTFATGGKWKWKGTEYAVFNTTAVDWASYFYINDAVNVLTDYTDLDEVETLFDNMTDPNNQEPILIPPARQLLVVPSLKATARRIVNSTEIRKATASSVNWMIGPNDKMDYEVLSSPLFRTQLASNTTTSWWVGNFSKAFAYMENWPITVVREPANAPVEFERDVIVRFKASERGAVAVIAPHYVCRSVGTG